MYFPDELWQEIKNYAGIYSITKNWDLTKLKKGEVVAIIRKYIHNSDFEDNNSIVKIISSPKKRLIRYFWEHINKAKLEEIYRNYVCTYYPYDPKLYNYGDVYQLPKYKRVIAYFFETKFTYDNVYFDKPFKVINITDKYLELISIHEDKTEKPRKIKIKRNIGGVVKIL